MVMVGDPTFFTNDYNFSAVVTIQLCIFVLFTLPKVYLIISGCILLNKPRPAVSKGLTIANLVLESSNIIILILSIVCLTQSTAYTRGYKPRHEL
jgi:cytochrome b subunit of formate dehydrogenase